MVSVKAHDDEIATVEEVLNARRGVDAAVRGDAYRQSGWTAFDPAATPYSADDIGRERALYGEQRSFAATDDVAVDDEGPPHRPSYGRPSPPRLLIEARGDPDHRVAARKM